MLASAPSRSTGKERDSESGLDYFGARYYGNNMGRFTSPDPLFFQKSMLTDPQRFNLYAYVRNNPLKLLDPTGKAIALTGDEEARKKKLALLQSKLGKAGEYLYDNVDKKSGKHFVGIYTNGPSGKGPAFESINGATSALSKIINNERVGSIEFAPEGSRVMMGDRVKATIGSVDIRSGKGPGDTEMNGDGTITSYVLAPGQDPGKLPGSMMSDGVTPGDIDTATAMWHELGHMLGLMQGEVGPQTNEPADNLENTIRRLDNPQAPVRMMHDPPPGAQQ